VGQFPLFESKKTTLIEKVEIVLVFEEEMVHPHTNIGQVK
jgi:hypothetical protein